MLSLPLTAMLAEFKPALWSSLAMTVSLYLVQPIVAGWTQAAGLIMAVGVGAVVYALTTWATSPKMIRRAWDSLGFRWAKQAQT
jgi:hypothetical protein